MSAARVSRSAPLPSSYLKATADQSEKQGIVTILGSDFQEFTNRVPSIRRTLSADMSSMKWLAQNGFSSPMKVGIASSEELLLLSAADHHHHLMPALPSNSDQQQQQDDDVKERTESPSRLDVWSSILADKANAAAAAADSSSSNDSLPPPYIHPLVKRSASTLSEKSLEICTESLGSETGYDGFSSTSHSETEDDKEDAAAVQQEMEPQTHTQSSVKELQVAKFNNNYDPSSCNKKKPTPKSFPPPLPSLARGGANNNAPSLHMQSHRRNGRLVLQAVSVPQTNYFQAKRQEGRLLLTLVNTPANCTSREPESQEEEILEDKIDDFPQVFGNFEEADGDDDESETYEQMEEEEEEEEEGGEVVAKNQNGVIDHMTYVMEQCSSTSLPTSGMINVHRSALMMKRLMGLGNKDPTWSNKLNKAVELMEVEDDQVVADARELTAIPQSLPPIAATRVARLISSSPSSTLATPPPSATAASSLNAYEYFWRNKNSVASIIDSSVYQECSSPLKENNNYNNKVVLKASSYTNNEQQQQQQQGLVLMRKGVSKGGDDCLIPTLVRGCKDSRRRSILFWQPYCIATS